MLGSPAPLEDLLTAALRRSGQRVTMQRVLVHRALHELGRHATAEEVRARVGERLPGMSPPTVYATLELLEGLGLARRIAAAGGPVRFDPRTDDHAHMACRSCGAIADLDTDVDAEPALAGARAAGFAPERAELLVSGHCAACGG